MSINPVWIVALASLLTALVAVAGYFLAKQTIQAMDKQREADLHLRLYDMWHNPQIEGAIQRTRRMDFKTIQDFNNFPEREDIHRVLNLLETVAIWVENGYISKELISATMLNIVVDAVDTYKPYIDHRRRQEPTDIEHLLRLVNDLRPLRHPPVPSRK